MPAQQHTGGCHCGQVRYEVTLDLDQVISCNCSICTKAGALLTAVSPDKFRLDSGNNMLSDYTFNKHVFHHLFCPDCGIKSFVRSKMPDGTEMVVINVRCLDNIDVAKLKPQAFDGRSR